VPLSLTMVRGLPRRAIGTSSSRGQAVAADRGIHDQRQGLAGEVVDDAQDPEAPAPRKGVGDEVQAPALVGSVRQRHGRPRAAAPPSHRQAFLAVEPQELLLVHADAFTLEQDAQPPLAEAATLRRQAPQSLAHVRIVRMDHAARRLGIGLDQPAGASLREAALRHQAKRSLPAGCRPDQFFSRRSFSADTSSIDSASSFISHRFSSSRHQLQGVRHAIPLYFAFQR